MWPGKLTWDIVMWPAIAGDGELWCKWLGHGLTAIDGGGQSLPNQEAVDLCLYALQPPILWPTNKRYIFWLTQPFCGKLLSVRSIQNMVMKMLFSTEVKKIALLKCRQSFSSVFMGFPFKLKVHFHFLTSLCTLYLNFADRKWFHTHKETFVQKRNCVKGLVEGLSLCSWFWAGSLFQPQCAQPQPNPVHRPNRDCPLPL